MLRRRSTRHARKLLLLAASHAFVAVLASIGCAAPVTYSPASESDITQAKDDKKSTDKNKKSSSDKSSKSSTSPGGGDDAFGDFFGDDDDDVGGVPSGPGQRPPGGPTTTTATGSAGPVGTTAPATSTTPTTPTGPTTTADPAQACYLSCVAPDAMTSAYVRCALNCNVNDVPCDDACWFQSGCIQNEAVCNGNLDVCDQTCPNGF